MKKLVYLVALLAAVAYGQDAGAVSGQVADGATGNPISGAVVVAIGGNGQAGRALTNERGAYRIGELAPGQYRVSAEAAGYEPAGYPEPVGVREGQVTPDINFRLRPAQPPPQGGISGRVVDGATGMPVLGAVVAAIGRGGAGRALTNERGVYLVEGLAAGTYQVTAEAAGYRPATYPDPVGVREGQVTPDINFSLRPAQPPPQGGISGRVVDAATGEPIVGAIVVAAGRNGQMGRALTNERGAYLIEGLAAGMYQVTAEARGYQPATYPDPVGVREGQVTPNIGFRLRPQQQQQGGISGRVFARRTGEPIQGALVEAVGRNGAGRARTNARGVYVIEGLAAGEYRVHVRARGYLPERFPRPVPVVEGRVTEGIDFELRPSIAVTD